MSPRKTVVAIALTALCSSASAFDFFDDTFLIEVKQGSLLSDKASHLGDGGFETSEGEKITFREWYSTKRTDASITFVTKVDNSLGILWGFSTGEHGKKYNISPSVKLGAIYIHQLTKSSTLTVKGSYIFGGKLKEKPCTADYGEIGGIQQVNCRMAASELPPEETLQYLSNERPRDYRVVMVQYSFTF
jgi:hypothetical protein